VKIKNKLYGSAFASIFLMIVIIVAVVVASNKVEEENEKRDLAEGVLQGVSELGLLTNEYLLFRRESSERDWNTKYNSVAKILIRGDKKKTESIRIDFIFIGDMFLQVTRNYKRTLTLADRNAPQEEIDSTDLLEEDMVGQLLVKTQSIISDAATLSEEATREARSTLKFSNNSNVLLLTLLAVVTMTTSVLVTRSISKPLKELTKGAEIIGQGDLDYRTGINTRDEVGLLSRAFDQMTERLKLTTVSRDRLAVEVDERQRAEEQRSALIAELEDKNAELEQFTYTVSHDLKSPLITIKGFLGALAEDAARGNTERMEADISRISGAADRMTQLLDELLELSRIGRVTGPQKEVPLGELAEEAVDSVAGRVDQRKVQVTVAADLPVVFGDRLRIREVLQNLVDNAVKFMGEELNPQVEIGARQRDGETVCFVRDNGMGIDPRYNQKVFGLFDKLDQKSDGTGVGLALVKRIVEVHGGRVWVESEGLGHGSTFYFTLPSNGSEPHDEVARNAG